MRAFNEFLQWILTSEGLLTIRRSAIRRKKRKSLLFLRRDERDFDFLLDRIVDNSMVLGVQLKRDELDFLLEYDNEVVTARRVSYHSVSLSSSLEEYVLFSIVVLSRPICFERVQGKKRRFLYDGSPISCLSESHSSHPCFLPTSFGEHLRNPIIISLIQINRIIDNAERRAA